MRRFRFKREASVGVTLLILLGILAIWVPEFFQPTNVQTLLVSKAPVLIAAVGMTLVIVARQIDISIGSQISVCGVVAGLLARSGVPMPLVAALTMLAGAGFGAINGVLVAFLGMPSIVATLATMVILRESLRWIRQGAFVRNLPSDFQWLGLGQGTGQWVILGVSLAVFVVFTWASTRLAAGRSVYATGSDPEAARLAGIQPDKVVFRVFVAMGLLSGLAALVSALRFSVVDPNDGMGMELQAIAAVVVGGAAVSGGRGTMLGSLLGVLLLGMIGPALTFLHVEPQWEKAIQGLVILLAVASDAFDRKGK